MATEMTDPLNVAASVTGPAAATNATAPRRRLLGTEKKGRKRKPPEHAVLCDLKPAGVYFKCAYAEGSGCTEGTDGSDRGYSGAYHAAGQLRGSRTVDYTHWDQYCQTHWRVIMGNTSSGDRVVRPSAAAAGMGCAAASRATSPSSWVGEATAPAATAPAAAPAAPAAPATPASAPAPAAATGAAGVALLGERAVVGRGQRHPAGLPDPTGEEVQKLRLSQLYFHGNPTPTMEDADAPRKLAARKQRHTELTEPEVRKAVNAIVSQLKEGMPMPGNDGALSDRAGWGSAWKDPLSWPSAYMELGEAANRARKCKGPGAWTEASKELARKHHLVCGTVVFLLPEVR